MTIFTFAAARCLAVLTVLACGAASASPASQTQRAALDACAVRAAHDTGFNGAVRLSQSDETIISRNFGAADAAGKVPIGNATRFNIASVGKLFTAVAVGILTERGEVALDAPIGRYLPDLDSKFMAITVRQLLQHTSGLGDFLSPATIGAINAAKTATELLPLALASPPAFPPGSKVAYSNSGYVVLGAIIEKVSGQSYAEFLKKEIFAPLGMMRTSLTSEDSAEQMTRMSPAGPLPSPAPVIPAAGRGSPAGGAFSTASDLARFLAALQAHRVVKPETLTDVIRPWPRPPARIGHNGGAPGANAEAWFYPESGWSMIVLSNYDPPVATRMSMILEQAMLAADTTGACAAAIAAPPPEPPGLIIRRHP